VVSAQTGRGIQTFSELTMEVWEEGGLSYLTTRGIGVTACSNGDLIRIRFELLGIFTGPTTVVYTGEFEVLSGGTGRYAYEGITGPLGSGLIEGNATLLTDATTGALTFAFYHRFDGNAAGGRQEPGGSLSPRFPSLILETETAGFRSVATEAGPTIAWEHGAAPVDDARAPPNGFTPERLRPSAAPHPASRGQSGARARAEGRQSRRRIQRLRNRTGHPCPARTSGPRLRRRV
jgi:hypothetical protein